MRKFLTAGVAALTAAGAISATATPAAAQPHGGFHGGFHGGWGGGYHGHGGWGYGVGAGLAGFALGAALASPYYYGPNYYYGPGYYGPGYYGPGYGYGYGPGYNGYGPATCVGSRQVWDPYYGRWVWQSYYYGCRRRRALTCNLGEVSHAPRAIGSSRRPDGRHATPACVQRTERVTWRAT